MRSWRGVAQQQMQQMQDQYSVDFGGDDYDLGIGGLQVTAGAFVVFWSVFSNIKTLKAYDTSMRLIEQMDCLTIM